MNCDRVFDVLTRGPFPTGDPSDDAVEIHLISCVECRRLAEALRPALELFEEAVTPEEGRDLPGYWGQLSVAPGDLAVSCAEQAGRHRAVERRSPRSALVQGWSSINVWRFAAAIAFGLVLGSLFHSLGHREFFRMESASTSAGNASVHPPAVLKPLGENSHQILLSLAVSDACWIFHGPSVVHPATAVEDNPITVSNSNKINCCLDCHSPAAARAGRVPRQATAAVQRSCQECHL